MPTSQDDYYWKMLTRQLPIISKEDQMKFKDSKIAVVGCGGIGGSVIEMLARMGVGELILIDKDTFDVTNLNRQVMSTLKNLNQSKAEVSKERVHNINPNIKIKAYTLELNENNVEKLLKESDVIIDALDNIITRVVLSRYCIENNKPFISGAIHGTMGQLTVFKNKIDYETMFNLPSLNKELSEETKSLLKELEKDTPPAIGPTPNIIGALEAIEAFKLIAEVGNIIEAPEIFNFDLLDLNSFNIEKF